MSGYPDPRISTVVRSNPVPRSGANAESIVRSLSALDGAVRDLRSDVARSLQIVAARLEALEEGASGGEE